MQSRHVAEDIWEENRNYQTNFEGIDCTLKKKPNFDAVGTRRCWSGAIRRFLRNRSGHMLAALPLLTTFLSSTPIHTITMSNINDVSQVAQVCATYSLSTQQFQTLFSRSVSAKATAYCPYSHFRVGATILTQNDEYINGANVENAAYPVGTCAERVAFGKAVTEGYKGFKALAVATDISPPASPCGMCRQLLVPSSLWRLGMDLGMRG